MIFFISLGESVLSNAAGNNKLPSILSTFVQPPKNKLSISNPKDFRQVNDLFI